MSNTYEIRLLCSVYEDHCETRLLTIKCGNLQDAIRTHERCERAIKSAQEGKMGRLKVLFGEDHYFAGTSYPFVFDYQGIWKITQEQVDPASAGV